MMKTFLTSLMRGGILWAVVFSCLFTLSAQAQNSSPVTQIGPNSVTSVGPAKGIGPAPANTKQHQILTSALSPQTRQTLQEAMNSLPAK